MNPFENEQRRDVAVEAGGPEQGERGGLAKQEDSGMGQEPGMIASEPLHLGSPFILSHPFDSKTERGEVRRMVGLLW